jgi:hypothetical protein
MFKLKVFSFVFIFSEIFKQIIGFSLINRPEIAIDKLKLVLAEEPNEKNKLNGLLFTFTVRNYFIHQKIYNNCV